MHSSIGLPSSSVVACALRAHLSLFSAHRADTTTHLRFVGGGPARKGSACLVARVLATSAGLLILSASLTWAQTNNVSVAVSNADFEAGAVLPDGWIAWSSGPDEDNDKDLRRPTEADFIWDRAISHSGSRSLYIWNDGPRWAAWRSSPVQVRGDTAYRLSVWIRKESGPSSTYLRVRRGGWTMCEEVNPGRDWVRCVLEFRTAPDVETITIELSDLGGNGSETWFDDLELVALSPRKQ
jgi:hypothetical protein